MRTLKVFIGYDHREAIAYHVLSHSIMRRASRPVSIQPIALHQFQGYWTRPRAPQQSTDFTFARFLTPWLAGDGAPSGVSIFMDCDMLCLDDICKLEDYAHSNPYADVLVVKHDYDPISEKKFLNQTQTNYPCKNWSSLMVFNGHRQAIRNLTPSYVNAAPAMDLHQFKWSEAVGALPLRWNHLVGEYEPTYDVGIAHFTLGGPWFSGYHDCEYSKEWYDELKDMLHRDSPSFDLNRVWL